MSRRVALIVSVLFWLAAAGLYLASMLTNFWITDIVENFGLFRVCVSSECFDIGWDLTSETAPLHIIIPRIMMLAGAAFVVLGFLVGPLGYICKKPALEITEGALLVVAGLVIFAACATFTGLNYANGVFVQNEIFTIGLSSQFHFSFYFGWISGLFFLISGVCGVIAGKNAY